MAEPVLHQNKMINEKGFPGDENKASPVKQHGLHKRIRSGEKEALNEPGTSGIRSKRESQSRERMGENDSHEGGTVEGKPSREIERKKKKPADVETPRSAGLAQAYVQKQQIKKGSNHKRWQGPIGEAYRDIERSVGQGRRDGYISDRTAGHFARQMVKTPRYVKNAGSVAVGAYRNIRYLSKTRIDVKNGVVSGKEARIAALRRGSEGLKEAGRATLARIGRETSEFYGSDDLGMEAVRKPKDVIVNGYRVLRATSGMARAMRKAPEKARKAIKRGVNTAKRATEYSAAAVRTVAKVLHNPVVLKTVLIGIVGVLVVVMLMAVVASISSVFASFTLTSQDEELTKTYVLVTELDADLNYQLARIENEIQYLGVNQFHYTLNGNTVGHGDMKVMTNTDYLLHYLDVRHKEYTLDGILDLLGNSVRKEVKAIHEDLYSVTRHSWEDHIPRISVVVDPYGNEHEFSWTEIIKHVGVSVTTIAVEDYIEAKSEVLFSSGQEEQYHALNEVGGMNLRQELGNPFPGFDWKTNLSLTTRFGWRIHPIDRVKRNHAGIDIGRDEGTPIHAVMGGTVTEVITSNEGYGNRIVIASGVRTNLYAHCKDLFVTIGQEIRRGEVIATVGNTGASTDPHLHLEFKKEGRLMNPAFFVATD